MRFVRDNQIPLLGANELFLKLFVARQYVEAGNEMVAVVEGV